MEKAYKLFRVIKNKKGNIYPLYVLADEPTPIGVWIRAKEGIKIDGKDKVKSRIGELALRPGWHCSDIPLAIHIGVRDENGNIIKMNSQHVWCEVEYNNNNNYQEQVNKIGTIKDKFVPKKAYFKHVPKDGYYRYKTNPNMLGEWIISSDIKIIKILSDEEVNQILIKKGYTPMERDGGQINLKEYGF